MASAIPLGFVDLQTASRKLTCDVNIIGVVTDVKPPAKSRGADYMCTFTLIDASSSHADNGLQVKFFRPDEKLLPKFQGTGDVVILRSIKIQSYRGMTIALSKWVTTWLVIPASSMPQHAPSNFFQIKHEKDPRAGVPSAAEMLYTIFLCNSRDRSMSRTITVTPAQELDTPVSQTTSVMPLHRHEKFSLIKDVQIDTFYDLVGQVVKIYSSNGSVELSMTDYTTNQLLYNYEFGVTRVGEDSREGDKFNYISRNSSNRNWPGPFGRMTLTVTLWPPHSDFAHSYVKEQDFVLLRNVRIRFSKNAKVEGSLHTDQRYTDRIDVSILKDYRGDDRVKSVLRRKLEYSKRFKAQSEDFIEESRTQKRKQTEPSESSEPLPKHPARKARRHQKGQLKGLECRQESKKMPIPKSLNRNIQCAHPAVPPRSLSSILSLSTHAAKTENGTSYILPFQNLNCRATVRVIDFFPQDLADFAVRCRRESEFDVLSENEGNDSSEDQSDGLEEEEREWEWRFGLILEDAMGSRHEKKDTVTVYVVDKDAEFLLGLDAENLRASEQALLSLREKLFLLWGDLEERKTNSQRIQPLSASADSDKSSLQPTSGNKQSHPNNPPATAAADNSAAPKGMPFQCCIKEYGIRTRANKDADGSDANADDENEGAVNGNLGWERRWRMWGVKIT